MKEITRSIELAAKIAYEAARTWCEHHNHPALVPWEQAEEAARESVRKGVVGVLAGNTPRDSHANWTQTRLADGWVYGEVKDEKQKTHPNLVPYDDLPSDQRAKNILFVDSVKATMRAFQEK